MTNWTKPREELAQIGAELCRLGYHVQHVSENMADMHYYGPSRSLAAKKLIPLIIKYWSALNGGQTEKQEKANGMADELRSEGWRPLFSDQGRCFWFHKELEISVNNLGGGFDGFEAATQTAYGSATRNVILDRR